MVKGRPIPFTGEERAVEGPAKAICAKFWCQQAR
jgi:hypothetical protein